LCSKYLSAGEGGGEGRRKIRRKNGGPYALLKYVPTPYFLIPLVKLLLLTNGPKEDEGWKDEGYFILVFSSYFFYSTLVTDGLDSVM
jgi:hypothetical protein